MKGFSDIKFLENYIKEVKDNKTGEMKPKLQDNFQTGSQKLLPFTLNPISGSVYDGSCGLNGVAGEFYRIKTHSSVEPISSPKDTEETIRKNLKDIFKMPDDDINRFVKVFNDVMFENNTLNVIDLSFFAFVPMKFFDKAFDKVTKIKKYRSGQPKMADYYVSIAQLSEEQFEVGTRDLFCEIVNECLQKDSIRTKGKRDDYFILPFIKESFKEDMKWLLKHNNNVIVKYLPLMLYFYASYSLMQTLMFMNKNNWESPIDKPKVITYMLSSERASEGQAAVKKGWGAIDHLPESFLNKMSSYAQALDILNLMFDNEEELMTFQEIRKRFINMDFDEDAKIACENVLERYQTLKRELLSERDTETGVLPDPKPIEVNSYEEFVVKLLDLCISLQSKDYPRMKVGLYSLVNIKLYEKRKDHSVLTLDEDMLLFLVAMMAKDERIRMYELYRRFREYGIEFSFQTKNSISDYLQKLNLLERKSDSGEAQYVRVIL